MKIQFEELQINTDTSFKIMLNPRMSDFFFWHFHPEFELVYIEGTHGTRYVGKHMSLFEESDLVLIGSYIPHLNFDYGAKTHYEKIVVHFRASFLEKTLANTPEFEPLFKLFESAARGVAFGAEAKNMVKPRLQKLPYMQGMEQFLELLSILYDLAAAVEKEFLHEKPVENQYNRREQERLLKLYRFIDEQYQRKIDIEEVAALSNLSNAAFCRYFKKMTRLTFTEFLNHYRINQAKKLLLVDKNVTETCFECGFESLSYFNRTFKKITGHNPLSFKKNFMRTF
ncbi:helix-turn-helix domain-containing protein [Runella zeae]|uniref:helix-turn-helix domain-containing protein n=1 Tax=Runella zeae TaxID=94255 RepID=UPI000428BAFA|nr:AraC family transcriptional regulator [Runella zeae]